MGVTSSLYLKSRAWDTPEGLKAMSAARRMHNGAMTITGRLALAAALVSGMAGGLAGQTAPAPAAWTPLFDGKSLNGWKVSPFNGRGQVRVDGGTITLGSGRLTGITWTGDFPKTGYEIRFEAARLEGNDFFAGLTFPVGDDFCSWINGGWDGTVVGLSSLDYDDASENDTSTARDFEKGRWYAFRLSVTTSRIQGWIDDALIIDADIRGRRVSLRPGDIDQSTPLGFSAYATTGGLRKIEYRLLDSGQREKP
jgi:hypothetical protein